MAKYNKFLVAALGVILSGLNVMYGMNPYVQMAINVAVMLGVYQVPNRVK